MAQLHKKFTNGQVVELFKRYLKKEIDRKYLQVILGISKTRFFKLLSNYQKDPAAFSIEYNRKTAPRISEEVEKIIVKELSIDREVIENPEVPLWRYNYSYIKQRLADKYKEKVSLPTVIRCAKRHDLYQARKSVKAAHDREVITNYAGELVQHDASIHLFSPAAKEKWILITSLDDYSRYILHAALLRKESTWAHIAALQSVFLQHGLPYSYYVDCHSIFRFVRGRDELWYRHHQQTDEATPQWKQVLDDCNVKVIYALSPQAKGKIERPYQWLQDHLVRTCVRENVTEIQAGRTILKQEIHKYNHRQVHSTTQEIPYVRFQKAVEEKKTLFRPFAVKPPFESPKDVFCLRLQRVVDAYRKVSLNNFKMKVNHADPRETVTLRIYPLNATLSEVRIWCQDKLVDTQKVKNSDLQGVHF
jgi:hypothetical protein